MKAMRRQDALDKIKGMIPSTLPVVCLMTGDFYGQADVYLRRMNAMLERHCPVPFSLVCYSDQPRALPAGVELKSCADWVQLTDAVMRPTTRKLGFFDADVVPFDEFLYLDLSLVIQRDMTELLGFAFGQNQDLVIVNDWFYPCYNSSVMRIRRGALQTIYDAFVNGTRYPQHVPGDQDFIYKHIAAQKLEHRVALFPAEQIVSYKFLRRLNETDAAAARQAVEAATIVKFHGAPKMHVVANPISNFAELRKFNLFGRRYKRGHFFFRDLRKHWRD